MGLSLTYSLADQDFQQTKSLGIFNISLNLLQAIARDARVTQLQVLSNSSLTERLELPGKIEVSQCDLAVRGKLGRIFWDQWAVYDRAKQSRNNWLFLPKGFASFVRKPPVRLATWVADGMQDFYRRNYPQAVSGLESAYFQHCFKATLRNSDVIFTISDFTTSEVGRIARELNIPAPPIHTIGVGFYPQPLRCQKLNRIVVLAGRFPHKRTDLALDYLGRWQQETRFDGTVDWIGSLPPELTLPQLPTWKLWQRLPEQDYRSMLGSARAVIYFSEYEGFGMPPVEAVLAGACPVYSDIPVAREVMGSAGFRFENQKPDQFFEALNSALRTPETQLSQWSADLLEQHQWQKVADRFLTVLREMDSR